MSDFLLFERDGPVVTLTIIALCVVSYLLQRVVPGWTSQWAFFPVAGDFYEGIAAQAVSPGACFVICGHSPTQDGEALHAVLEKDAAYVGMLGSRRKIAAMMRRWLAPSATRTPISRVRRTTVYDMTS